MTVPVYTAFACQAECRRCWLFKAFSTAARRSRLFRGDAVCTRLGHTSPRVHTALRAHPPLVPVAVSFQVLHSSAAENCSHQIVWRAQRARFHSLSTVTRTLQSPWIPKLKSSNKLSAFGIDPDVALHIQNGSDRRPSDLPRMEKTEFYTTDMGKGDTTAVRRRVEPSREAGLDSKVTVRAHTSERTLREGSLAVRRFVR
jgi:hypothetical protein